MKARKFVALAAAGIIPIIVAMSLPMGTWADFTALPMHPLIVHGVIVALPVAALWLLLAVWKPAVLERTYPALWALSVLAVIGVVAAKSSGDSLAAAVGLPEAHAAAGNRLIPVSIAMAASVLAFGFFWMVRPSKVLVTGSRALGAVAAVAVLPLVYLAGHSGAESVWEKDYAVAQEPIAVRDLSLSMDEVARHDTADDCWAVVEGNVYDLTTFIARHPAGSGDIEEMCGTDATDDFVGEHGGQGEPEKWLETLKIGVIAE